MVLEHSEDSARRILRIDRSDVIQTGCDGRENFLLVAQPIGFSGRVMLLIVVEAAHQNRQLGAELGHLVDGEPVPQGVHQQRAHDRPFCGPARSPP